MKINVGIDLGTTYSAVATFSKEQGKVRILKNSIDKECTPSVVHIENGVTVIGEDAKAEQKAGNVNTVAFYKSMMGDVNYSAYVDGEEYSAEDLSGKFLAALVKDIETTNNVEIDGAVITVPAYFNEKQREATIRAGQKAGLKVLKIINEPTSAIIAYGLTGGAKKNVMVYDLGGGTFDVTIAQVNGTRIDVLATNGNHQLGGKDWDRVLLEEIDDRFYSDYGVRISSHEDDVKELQVKCEEAKKRLTSVSATTINIMCDGYTGKYEITREFFDERTYSLLYETVMLVESCFDEISEDTGRPFGWGDIDEVVLVGGSTRMPQVKDMVIKAYGKPPITKDINVDTIVATGAAMQAELCVNQTLTMTVAAPKTNAPGAPASSSPITLTIANNDIMDVTSHSLGMLALASDEKSYINSIIIKKNSKINEVFSKEYIFGGDKLEVFIMQGETRDPYECDIIGKYTITGMPRGKNKISVNFLYNHNGVVDATANLEDGTRLTAVKEEVTETLDEIINRLNREREEARKPQRIEVMIMIDSSGSMCGSPAAQAKDAAKGFIDEFDLNTTFISVVEFADRSAFNCKFSNKSSEIKRAIDRISPGDNVGVCNREAPIGHNYKEFTSKADARIIVVLTDGCWSTRNSELTSSQKAKDDGIIIYAIGFGTADEAFLRSISSNGAKKVDLSQLKTAFKEVASSIATEVTSGNTLR